jgi:DNA adenine methylase
MLTYKIIKKFPKQLIKRLEVVENEYLKLDQDQRKTYYYKKLRDEYNKIKTDIAHFEKDLWLEKATLLIALNKTCFNGLFRQNSEGNFNVPIGRYKNPRILDRQNLLRVSQSLQDTTILCTSYNRIKVPASKRVFIYFDPPYRPLNTTSSFTKYSKGDFDDKDQQELAQYFRRLAEKDNYLLLSNSNPKNTNPEDNFFDKLYKGFNIEEITAKRFINSNAKKRGPITELLIRNY